MSTSIYYYIATLPAFSAYGLSSDYEALARRFAASGLLRIEAGEYRNFVSYMDTARNRHYNFSARELQDPALMPRTRQVLERIIGIHYVGNVLEERVERLHAQLTREFSKHLPLSPAQEMIVARLLVQATEPPVLELLMWEQTELFVSFGHSVGDVMDIATWKQVGENSGLQGHAVYVSSGGNPLADRRDTHVITDGFPAAARLMIIAGQELGHYADMIRSLDGRWVGRHSSNISISCPTENVRQARNADIARLNFMHSVHESIGLSFLVRRERAVRFYRQKKVNRIGRWLIDRFARGMFFLFTIRARLKRVAISGHLPKDVYPATQLLYFFRDMRENLAPNAEVYRNADPLAEEAMACAEALARVPQQVVKWGHAPIRFATPALYHVYYREVIPKCVESLSALRGRPYVPPSAQRSMVRRFVNLFSRRAFRYIRRPESVVLELEE